MEGGAQVTVRRARTIEFNIAQTFGRAAQWMSAAGRSRHPGPFFGDALTSANSASRRRSRSQKLPLADRATTDQECPLLARAANAPQHAPVEKGQELP